MPIHAVVELEEALPITRGAAHVGKHDCDPEVIQKVVVSSKKPRAKLAFRPTVDAHDDRTLSRKLLGIRRIDEDRDRHSVEGLPLDELRFGVGGSVNSSDLADGPVLDLRLRLVHGYDVSGVLSAL